MSRWVWAERGETITLTSELGGQTVLAVDDGVHPAAGVTLTEKAAHELVGELLSLYGHELEDRADGLEHEREALLDTIREQRTTERTLRAELERMKTAGQLADQRTRELERRLELTEARATLAERRASGSLS